MTRQKPFTSQLIVIGGFLVFLYIFFALATSIYRDYKLERNIGDFQNEINKLAELAKQKPSDVKYYETSQYKDRYAKENLGLINLGEKVIIIPKEEPKTAVAPEALPTPNLVLLRPIHEQWWEYFFGDTLTVEIPKNNDQIPMTNDQNGGAPSTEQTEPAEG
jgi:cell division protein FtsB